MLQRPSPRLVLASASASRRALLEAAGLAFAIQPADLDEAVVKQAASAEGASAETAALRLADLKAAVVVRDHPDALVVGADQILVCDGVWFDKPADLLAARQQLLTLRGKTHTLATAAVCYRDGRHMWSQIATPRLTMRDFSHEFIDAYLAAEGDHVTGSVGAYRLECLGMHLFSAVEGEYSAILGLPMLALLEFLRRQGSLII